VQPSPPLPEWEYVGATWPAARAGVTGWDHPSVAAVMLNALPEFLRVVGGSAPLGIFPLAPHVRSESGHNISMTFGYVLARAAHAKSALSMLDWGGALGHYALMAQYLLPEVALEVTIKERPELCRIGADLMPWVKFETEDAACFARTYDLVMASTSLQYAEDWRAMFGALAQAAQPFLFVTRLSVVRGAPSFVVVQRPYAYGYQTDYLSWVINRAELLDAAAAAGLTLEREFIAGDNTAYHGAPEASETAGFLFKKAL
jgi:putative methyltransferase (TIGR04325 family)